MASLSDHVRNAVAPFRWREALNCAPAIALLLIAGLVIGKPLEGAIAAGAAFSVGFGAYRRIRSKPWLAMSLTAAAMTAAAFLGSTIGQYPLPFTLCSATLAALVAWFALYEENIWWIALETAIAFFVAGYFAGPLDVALDRALAVAIGGTVQTLLVGFLREREGPIPAQAPVRPALFQAHAFRAAASVGIATWLALTFKLGNGYWAPMTALIVLKPGLRDTGVRGLFRVAGTVGGCAAASLFALAFPSTPAVLVVAILVCAWLAYALQRANYAVFSAAVSATVVFLLALHEPEAVGAVRRVIATLAGGGVALAVAYLGRRPPMLRPTPRGAA
ncbi:MAG: hypothetical protein BGN86_00885 [Caulobacterales bacterium 68-7]|nr:MAG: hypothetical protein BGN86_00885 [Caulobacterales bacterium 68-7]